MQKDHNVRTSRKSQNHISDLSVFKKEVKQRSHKKLCLVLNKYMKRKKKLYSVFNNI